MAKKEKQLIYIDGMPKKDKETKKEPRSEFDIKWDKYISGEATAKELSDIYTNGDINILKKCKIGEVSGFSGKMDKMRALVVHIGYSKKEIESKEFKDYMKRTKTEVESVFSKKNIELGFHIPSDDMLLITSYGFERFIQAEPREISLLKKRMQEELCGKVDILDIRINPKLVNISNGYFCTASKEERNYLTPGPVKNNEGLYQLEHKFIAEHEMMHCISYNSMKYNPMFFGDGFVQNISSQKARYILKGNHLEFVFADDEGKPFFECKSLNKTMKKVLSVAKPKDENIFIVDSAGNEHKILVINPGNNVMRDYFTNEERAEAIRKGTYITKAQRIAIDDVIKDYLVGEKRLVADKEVQKPKLVTKNNSAKTSLVSKIAKSNNARG